MSPEHVHLMNERLAQAPEVSQLLEALEAPLSLAYVLSNGPAGETVYWSVELGPSVRFGLAPLANADVLMRGEWSTMIQVVRGEQPEEPIVPLGAAADVERVGALLEALRPYATVDTEIPQTAPTRDGDLERRA